MGLQEIVAQAATAAFQAIGNLNQDLILQRKGNQGYDPIQGTIIGGATIDYPCKGVLLNYSLQERYLAGATIAITDKKCLIQADTLPVKPELTDYVISAKGKQYNIASIKETKPNMTCFLYELHLKVS